MGLTFGFYNSLNGDRKYNATQMSQLFDGIIRDGIFMSIGTSLKVTAQGGMTVQVGLGRAWFNHTWSDNDALIPLTVIQSELVLNRVDTVVLEVNATDEVRANTIKIIKGTPASSPVATTLIRSLEVNQYALAQIYVGKGVTSITNANITNKVGTSGTPFITGILETMNIDALILQWGAEWNEWNATHRTDFVTWMNTQQADYESWSAAKRADFLEWSDTQESNFSTWSTEQQAGFLAWSTNRESSFDDWFAMVQDTLNGDTAGQLLTLINTKVSKGATWGDLKGVI